MPSARRMQWAKIRIGATVFVALLILGVLMALLTGGTVLEPKVTISTYVPDAAGLYEGTPVRLNGIPVGTISSVRFSGLKDPDKVVEVRMEIAERFLPQVTTNSVAAITSENVQGEKYLDITRGRGPAALAPGGVVPFQPAPEVLKSLDLAQFERRMRDIDALIADIEAGKGPLGQLIKSDGLYRSVALRLAELQKALHAAASPQQDLGQLLYRDTLYEDILAPVRRLDASLAAMERGEGQAGRLLRDTGQYDRWRSQVTDIRRQLADLNAGTGGAGSFLNQDRLYTAWNRRVASLIRAVDSFNAGEGAAGNLLVNAQPYESIDGALRELQRTMRDFRQDPQKFLRIDIF